MDNPGSESGRQASARYRHLVLRAAYGWKANRRHLYQKFFNCPPLPNWTWLFLCSRKVRFHLLSYSERKNIAGQFFF